MSQPRRRLGGRPVVLLLVAAVVVATVLLVGPLGGGQDAGRTDRAGLASSPSAPRERPATPAPSAPSQAATRHVVVVSMDGVGSQAVERLGRRGAPHRWAMRDGGASTLQARTMVEQTVTVPNHTSMVTGRTITRSLEGHGVTWDDDRPGTTVQAAAGHRVASVFSELSRAGLTSTLLVSKAKLALFQRSWPRALAGPRFVVHDRDDAGTVRAAVRLLRQGPTALTFVHLGAADKAGHSHGWLSPRYLAAVRRVDAQVGRVAAVLARSPRLRDAVLVVTADHGGTPGQRTHSAAGRPADYRIPFLVDGAPVAEQDLYDLNPGYRSPGRGRPGLTEPQPVLNGDVANLVTGLLGVRAVPGSRFGNRTPLQVLAER